jgi:hypothetical protein
MAKRIENNCSSSSSSSSGSNKNSHLQNIHQNTNKFLFFGRIIDNQSLFTMMEYL